MASAKQQAARDRFAAAARRGPIRKGAKLSASARKSPVANKNPSGKSPSRARRAARSVLGRLHRKTLIAGALTPVGAAALRFAGAGDHSEGLALLATGVMADNDTAQFLGALREGSVLLNAATMGTAVSTGNSGGRFA